MFIDEISALLVATGGWVMGQSLFTNSTQPVPQNGNGPFTSLIETPGGGFARTHNGESTEFPTAQFTVRAKSPSVARAKAKEAFATVGGANGLSNTMLSGVWYVTLRARQGVMDMGVDAQGRAMFVFNIEAEKKPS